MEKKEIPLVTMKTGDIPNYHWLNDDRFSHLMWTTRRYYEEIIKEFRRGCPMGNGCGQEALVGKVIENLMYVTEQYGDIVRGKDKPMKQSPPFKEPEESYGADD